MKIEDWWKKVERWEASVDLVGARKTFWRRNVHGDLEEVDVSTGQILRVCSNVQTAIQSDTNYIEVKTSGGQIILVSRDVNADKYLNHEGVRYSQALLDEICNLIMEGETLKRITKLPGMPSLSTLARWRAEVPGCSEQIEKAREMRAEVWHDELVEEFRNRSESMTDATDKKTRADILKWLAQVGNRKSFGNQVKVEASGGPGVVIIQTGVPSREAAVVDEGMRLVEAGKSLLVESEKETQKNTEDEDVRKDNTK